MKKILNKNVSSIETRPFTKLDLKVMIELAEFKEFLDEFKKSTERKKDDNKWKFKINFTYKTNRILFKRGITPRFF